MLIKKKKYKNLEVFFSNYQISYEKAINYLEKRVNKICKEEEQELVWFLEHPSVYTTGRGHLIKKKFINSVPVINTGRGGKLTWHGPGQRIIYLAIDLKKRNNDIRKFINLLESFVISTLNKINIECYRKENLIGIWTKKNDVDAKIASFGLRVSKGIIYHGISININCKLDNFYKINPCGITNALVTSVKEIKKEEINLNEFDKILFRELSWFC